MAYKDKNDPRLKEARLRHYYKNKDKYYLTNKKTRSKIRDLVNGFKNVPCADCKIKYPPYVMDFDHREPKKKKGNVNTIMHKANIGALVEEIKKCDVVCANCHRIRTAKMVGYE